MNEPKRRGRPPKVKDEPVYEERHEWVVTATGLDGRPLESLQSKAQAYAKRVWDGQGATIPRVERLRRVAKALEGQGLSMEGVSL